MSALQLPANLVSVDWLNEHLDHPKLLILDASWHMPATNRSGHDEWHQLRIGHAGFFDYDNAICDPDASLPHTMPSAELFQREVRKLGLNQDSVVVVYDSQGLFSAPRAWWMLKAMGHDAVAVLDGGLPAWQEAGFEVNKDAPRAVVAQGNFVATPKPLFCDADRLLEVLHQDLGAVLDARGSDRFYGRVDEPRPGLRSGHMPGAQNLPYSDLLKDGKLKPVEELDAMFPADPSLPLYFTCGSGVTACLLALAASTTGREKLCVYDGSWAEWGLDHQLPISTD